MDGVDEEVTALDVVEVAHIQSKESEYALKPESNVLESREMVIPSEVDYPSSTHELFEDLLHGENLNRNVLESQEMITPSEADYPSSSHEVFADLLDGKSLNRNLSAVAGTGERCSHSHPMDDTGVVVEELTLRNYTGANLAVVGTSNNRERMQIRENRWQHLFQFAGGSGSGSSHGAVVYRENVQALSDMGEGVGCASFPDSLTSKPLIQSCNTALGQAANNESRAAFSDILPAGGIRTKILSKSGFSEFFMKSTLKGKGVICRGPARDESAIELRGQNNKKAAGVNMMVSDASLSSSTKSASPSLDGVVGSAPGPDSSDDGLCLREWLKFARLKVNKLDSLRIFKQILDLINLSHSQGLVLRDLWPSCFKLLPSSEVKYVGSFIQREFPEGIVDQGVLLTEDHLIGKRPIEEVTYPSVSLHMKKQKFTDNVNFIKWRPVIASRPGFNLEIPYGSNYTNGVGLENFGHEIDEHTPNAEYKPQYSSGSLHLSNIAHLELTPSSKQLEEKCYTSPEGQSKRSCTMSSNIYHLGVLLFELLGSFNSEKAHIAAMLDLRHRILPPQFLSENPKEAGFCLWLLHPEPSSRPTMREILESELMSGLQEGSGGELPPSINQDDMESEILLHFLGSLKEQKLKHASKLVEDVRCLEADIEEVKRRHSLEKSLVHSCSPGDHLNKKESKFLPKEPLTLEAIQLCIPPCDTNDLRLTKNISQLESAYFSMRSKILLPETDGTTRLDKDLLKNREKDDKRGKATDRLGAFFDGLCKYARYSKFEIRGILRNGDFSNSANVICSLSFDRDEDYFAAAGVSKKIKIFEFHALFNESVDIHYPAVEMLNRSKLSCVCWNNYIKNYLASTDHDGVVKLWDVGTGQGFSQHIEHQKRAWSVDFSHADPTKFASGSDDCSVKLWSINEKNSLSTIRSIANICCVQFSAHSPHLLSFGSADYKTYCYDLRNTRNPWCILNGHSKAVSYVKFLDSETLISASTDSSLKLWDLNKTSCSGLSTNACYLTLNGHTNEKNFVGLCVADGFVACGSETNEVYAYHRSMPMPITSYKFGSIDPISGKETDDDNGLFVSSVCWRGKSDMVIAANTTGCIKVLQMV